MIEVRRPAARGSAFLSVAMAWLRRCADRWPRLVLVVYCLALWLPGLFSVPATDRDESRFAQATRQMLESGNLVEIRNGEEARNRKPIGIHWLQLPGVIFARATRLAAPDAIWPYRLPSLAGAMVAVLATFRLGRRIAGDRAGLLAGAMLGGSVLLCVEADIAKTDAALLAATTVAQIVLAHAYLGGRLPRRAIIAFWCALGLGVLLKGPITPMVTGLTAVTLAVADRGGGFVWLRALRPRWGVPLALALIVPWFVAIGIATHGQFFRDAVGGDLAGKLAGGAETHGAPPGTHLLLLSLTLFPAAPIVVSSLPSAWAGRRERATRFLIAWAVPSWLVFEAAPTKLPHYPLPLFPALCLLGACWACSPARRPAPRWLAGVATTLSVAVALLLGAAALALPFVIHQTPLPAWLSGVPAALAAGLLIAIRLRRFATPARAATASLAAMPLLVWSLLWVELPHAAPLWVSRAACSAADAQHPSAVGAVGYAEPSLLFACGTATRLLPDGGAGAAFLQAAPGRILLVEQRRRAEFDAAAVQLGLGIRDLGSIGGLNYSNGRIVALRIIGGR